MKTRNILKGIFLSYALLIATTAVSAATIISQDFDPLLTTAEGNSDFGANNQRASSFSLSGATQSINTISWLGTYNSNVVSPGTDNFTIRIFSDNGNGLPEVSSSILDINVGSSVNRVDTGVEFSAFNIDIYSYQANLGADITLTAGVNYWLSIVDDIGTSGADNWRWAISSLTTGTSAFRQLDGDNWGVTTFNEQFQYELASVPIPAALWLMLSGVAGLAAFKRKQQA